MISRRARQHAGRVIAGSGAQEPGPRGGGIRHHPLPHFGPAPGQGGGYTGLQGVLAALQGGISQNQYQRMDAGHTGGQGWGAIGGMHGALQGLSPYAVHFLTQNLLQKKAYEAQDTTGLEGDALFRAQLMNNLGSQNAEANPTYQLRSGIDADFLGQLFGQGFSGHSAYEKGFNAEGQQGGPRAGFLPPKHRPFRPGRVMRRPLR